MKELTLIVPDPNPYGNTYWSVRPGVGTFNYLTKKGMSTNKKTKQIEKTSGSWQCREGLMSALACHFAFNSGLKYENGNPIFDSPDKDKNKMYLPKLRLLLSHAVAGEQKGNKSVYDRASEINKKNEAALDERYTEAVRVLNIIEDHLGMLKTRLYKVIPDNLDATRFFYAVEGSRRWQKAPHVLSLFILMLRTIGATPDVKGYQTFDEVMKGFHSISGNTDKNYLRSYSNRNRLRIFLETFNEIYKGYKTSTCFNGTRHTGGLSKVRHDGIDFLMTGKTRDPKAAEKFSTMIKKAAEKAKKAKNAKS